MVIGARRSRLFWPRALHRPSRHIRYLMSVSSRNIGRYIEMMITPTIKPTPIIMIGSMIEVSVALGTDDDALGHGWRW